MFLETVLMQSDQRLITLRVIPRISFICIRNTIGKLFNLLVVHLNDITSKWGKKWTQLKLLNYVFCKPFSKDCFGNKKCYFLNRFFCVVLFLVIESLNSEESTQFCCNYLTTLVMMWHTHKIMLVLCPSWSQFHQHSTSSFYACKSRKRKKATQLTVFFALLVSARVKAAHRMLMKLTLGRFRELKCTWIRSRTTLLVLILM